MQRTERIPPPQQDSLAQILRILLTIAMPILTVLGLWYGFFFLRDSDAPQLLITVVAIIWGVGGIVLLYIQFNWLVEQLPTKARTFVQPYVFVGPAILMLGWYLAVPTIRSLWQSFFDATSSTFVGFANYIFAFTNPAMLKSFRNNIAWMVLGTGMSVVFGLLIAVLADRSRFEVVAKSLIFLPMAISFVGAGVIWNFVYFRRPPDSPQIGLLNGIVTAFGGEPVAWLTKIPWRDLPLADFFSFNNFFLIIILVWLQTGFAMVLLSAALKGVPGDILEAARIDGANEFQVFFRVILPSIKGTIITVSTTILIATLKIFDIVFVMTNGNFGTEVIASQQYKQMFVFGDYGRGTAIAIILLLAVVPVMVYNLRQFRERRAF